MTFFKEDAGSHRNTVGTDIPKFFAIALGDIPFHNKCFAELILETVILHLHPPVCPCWRTAPRPDFVHFCSQAPLHFGQANHHHIEKEPSGR